MERVPQSHHEQNEAPHDWREQQAEAISAVEHELADRLAGLEVASTIERIEALRDMVAAYGEVVPGTQLPANNELRFHAEYAAVLLKTEEEAALEAGEVPADDYRLQFQLREQHMAMMRAQMFNDNESAELRDNREVA